MVSRELATLGFDFPDDEALRKAVLGETGMQAFPTAGYWDMALQRAKLHNS